MTKTKIGRKDNPVSTEPDAPALENLAAEAEEKPGESTPDAPAPAATSPAPGFTKSGKKIGRPPTSKKAPAGPAPPIVPRSVALAVIKAPYEYAARKYGDHWRLTDAEAESMADPHLALAQEYLPDAMRQHPALYSVLLLHALTIFGKTEIHYKLKAQREEEAFIAAGGVIPGKEPIEPGQGSSLTFSRIKPGDAADNDRSRV